MKFINKIKSFIKFYTELAIDNKLSLVFTLLFPIVYQLVSVKIKSIYSFEEFINISVPMIAYIIVSTALNGVTMSIIATRNSGFIKAYYFASGSRWAIYWANLIVQLVIVLIENTFFIIALMVLYKFFSLSLLLYLLLVTAVTFPVIALGFNVLFLLSLRQSTLAILSTSLLLGFLLLFNAPIPASISTYLFLNPYTFIKIFLSNLLYPNTTLIVLLIISTIFYSFIGYIGFQKFDLQDKGREL